MGAALFLAIPLTIVLADRRRFRERLHSAAVFLIVSILPVAGWLGRNMILGGSATNRTLGFHPPDGDTLRRFLDVLTSWFVPGIHSHWLEAALFGTALIAALALSAWLVSRPAGRPRFGPVLALGALVYIVCYLAGLIVSLTFFNASTRVDSRILSPIFLAGVVGIFSALGSLPVRQQLKGLPALASAALVLLIASHSVGGLRTTLESVRLEGMGFASRTWHESETLAWIRRLPDSALVYSDQPAAVWYWTSREVLSIPQRLDPVTRLERPDYREQMGALRRDLADHGAALVLFSPGALPEETASFEELTRDLVLLLQTPDAQIYAGPGTP